MPTYDYQCETCGKVVEVFHSMTDTGPEFCNCDNRGRMRRLLSAGSGVIFKGSGFYITDYARKSGSNGTGSSAGSGSPTGEKSESSDSKGSAESTGTSENSVAKGPASSKATDE